jgi:serine protease Do
MNTSDNARHFILTVAILAVTFGLTPRPAFAQRGNPAPDQRPPRAGAAPRPAPPAPPSLAATDGAGWLGITMSEVTPEKAQEAKLNDLHGAVVTGVSENSPAAKAGLAGGDIITDFRGQRVEGTIELARLVRETPPGRVAKLSVWRDGRSRDMSVEIGRASNLFSGNLLPPDFQDRVDQFQQRLQRRFQFRNTPPPPGGAPQGPRPQFTPRQRGAVGGPVLGITVQDVSGQLGAYLKVPEGQGVLITEVQAGSTAEKGGLHAGDVVTSVDGQRVRNTAELRAQVRRTTEARTAALQVIRNGAETTVNVEVSAAARPGARPNQRSSSPI